MNPQHTALLQLVDYVEDDKHLAVGDLVCHEGKWVSVVSIETVDGVWYREVRVRGEDGCNPCVGFWKGNPIARIPRPLIDLLKLTGEGHPHR